MSEADQPPQSPFERFERLVKGLVRVPKREIDEKQREHEAKKASRPKRA